MPKSKEDILALFKTLEGGGEDYIAGFNSILAEGAKTAKTVTELETKLQDYEGKVGSLTDRYNKVADFVGLQDGVEDVEAALAELKKQKAEGDKTLGPQITELTSQLNEMKRNLKKITDEKANSEKIAGEERAKRHSMIRDMELRNALEEGKAVKPSITARLLMNNVKVLDDDRIIFVGDDGAEVTVSEGVKSFLSNNPEYVINSQNPGGGGGGGPMGEVDFDKMSHADYRAWREKQK